LSSTAVHSFTHSIISRSNLYVQNTKPKSNDMYLLVMPHCNWIMRNWTRQRLETDTNVPGAVSRKTIKCSNNNPCLNRVWTSEWWCSRTLVQCRISKWKFCKGFQWCYVSSNAEDFRVIRNMDRFCYVNWDVKMQHFNVTWNTSETSLQNEML